MIVASPESFRGRNAHITDPSRRDLSDFVPEGLNDRSQAIYCLDCAHEAIRPVGYGLIAEPQMD